jgi:hypothetical protein
MMWDTQAARKHSANCHCWRCYAMQLGKWLDALGAQTEAGRWSIFLTTTYRNSASGANPSAGFGHHCFESFVNHVWVEIGSRVEYVLSDQNGELHGRFHQHALLSASGLEEYPRGDLEAWLRERAGWSRALPFQEPAAYYLARYIGRNVETADWRVEVGPEVKRSLPQVGRLVTVKSADVPSALFHQGFPRRKR